MRFWGNCIEQILEQILRIHLWVMKNNGKYQEMPKNLVKIFQTIWNVWKLLNQIEHTLIFVGKLLKFGQNISKLIEDDWA